MELPKLNPLENSEKSTSQSGDSKDVACKEPSSFNMDVIMVRSVAAVEVEDTPINMPDYVINEESAENNVPPANQPKPPVDSFSELLPNNEIKTKTIDKKQEWSTINDTIGSSSNDITKEKKTFGIKLNTTNNVSHFFFHIFTKIHNISRLICI